MLNQQEIQRILKEIGLDKLAEISQYAEFDNWTKLSSKPSTPNTKTFIEITTTTVAETEQGRQYGELGRNPK